MIDFLIKSTISLAVLLAVYHLVLEKEKMHQFNRFYLLFSIVFSLAIPFITIEIIEEIAMPNVQNSAIQINQGSIVLVEETNYFPFILWSIYGLITFLFSIRFARNISKTISKINANKRIDYKKAKLVLLEENVLPHTFLKFIFINETDYNNQKIETELFSHELTHVIQKHTFDVLFIEILKTIFWFNPLYLLYKKAIQLNHEFLADEKVVTTHNNVSFYQHLLLSKSNDNPIYQLTSNLNYSLTKKRLIMMTKTTSQTKAIIKKIALIPFIFGLVFFLCFKTVAQEKTTTPKANKSTKEQPSNEKRDDYYAGVRIMIKDNNQNVKLDKQYEELTLDDKNSNPIKDTKDKELVEKKSSSLAAEKTLPDYLGDMQEFYKFFSANYKIPSDFKGDGKIYISFMVETDGTISDFEVLRDLGFGTGEEAIRVLKLTPKWIPGKEDGKVVRMKFALPIAIQAKK